MKCVTERNVRVVCPYCGNNVFANLPLNPGFGSYVVRCSGSEGICTSHCEDDFVVDSLWVPQAKARKIEKGGHDAGPE
jgi:hypothetical protein